ncbi:hypothetical protein [Gilvimarinus algae]|uniref:Ricin B lectin domain-containing protein n=1 Tax=Gilvimarinus algae TaxID=3058037 RepID=A0ABT8TIV0_9GAMM|nr:hypothetical protein [Gilvimarinus sp. SDUM040014]MDO3383515.1 hypothetical protein [Gilvimarinus sp. SDUM040014]
MDLLTGKQNDFQPEAITARAQPPKRFSKATLVAFTVSLAAHLALALYWQLPLNAVPDTPGSPSLQLRLTMTAVAPKPKDSRPQPAPDQHQTTSSHTDALPEPQPRPQPKREPQETKLQTQSTAASATLSPPVETPPTPHASRPGVVFNPTLRRQLREAQGSDPRAATTDRATSYTDVSGRTYVDLGKGTCLRSAAKDRGGITQNWYLSNCQGSSSEGDDILAGLERQLEDRAINSPAGAGAAP